MKNAEMNNMELQRIVGSIIAEGEEIACQAFREHMRRMEEVLRFDFGTKDEGVSFACQMLRDFSRKGKVVLHRKWIVKLCIWGACRLGKRPQKSRHSLGHSEV